MRIASIARAVASACLVLSAAGCPDDPPELGALTPALGPLAAGDFIVQGDAAGQRLVVLTPDHGQLAAIDGVPLAGPPSLLVPVPGQAAVLVQSRSHETLDVVDLAHGLRRTLVLGAPFEALAIADDGKEALAYFPPGSATTVFYNDNEVAQVDLDPALAPSAAVRRRTLASLGGAPIRVDLSPAVAFGAGTRRYAFVSSEEHVAVVDLADPDMDERSVPLVSLTTGGRRTPRAVDFAVDHRGGDALWALVSTVEAASVYALQIVPAAPLATPTGGAHDADFDVRLSQLSGIGLGGAARLVTLPDGALASLTTDPAGGKVTLTDVATATGHTLPLSPGVSQIALFTAPLEGSDDGAPDALQAVVWAPGTTTFHVIDLAALAAGSDKAFRTRTTRSAFASLLPIPGTALFVMFHASDTDAVSVLDAATDRITSFGRTGAVADVALVPDLDRLFLLTRLGSQAFLVSVDLATLHPESANVPGSADGLLVLPGVDTVATFAYATYGDATLWPADDTRTISATAVPGFLVDHLLDRAPAPGAER